MDIGKVIRSLREDKGWSQEKLALEAGMATSHVSRIERGERRMPTTRLEAMARALGTSPAAVYAVMEGVRMPKTASKQGGDITADYSREAIELRKILRKLSLPSRHLVVDFARMLAKRTSA